MIPEIDTAIGFVSVMLLLSLVITTIVQAIAAVLDLRGNNLVVALANLFEQISPEMEKKGSGFNYLRLRGKTASEELAAAVAGHSSLVSTFFTRAKAIRPDELVAVLKQLASKPDQLKQFSQPVQDFLTKALAERVPGGAADLDQMKTIADSFAQRFPAHEAMLRGALMDIAGSTTKIEAGIDQWFQTVMDRASDRFSRNCRFWTVLAAAGLAFGLQIDSILIYRQIWSSPDVRAKLVQQSDAAIREADQINSRGNRASNVLQQMSGESQWSAQKAAITAAPGNLQSCADGKNWIAGNKDLRSNPDFINEFNDACMKDALQAVPQLTSTLTDINSQISQSQLRIFGVLEKVPGAPPPTYGGELLTLVLLSLGAPFWYNALRQLSNLKPSVSQKIKQESGSSGDAEGQKAAAASSGS